MKKIILVLGVSAMFLAGGCDDGSGKLKEIKEKMCACKDAACVETQTKALTGLEGEVKETDGNKKLLTEIMTCAATAAMGGAMPTPTAAPTPTPAE